MIFYLQFNHSFLSTYMYMCVHTYIHVHTCIYTHIHTYIFFLGPTPDIILTSSTLRLPTHPDYNQATLNCTATLPGTNQLAFDKVFMWTMSGTNVTGDATTPTDPRGMQSISTLTTDFTIAGDIVIICEVTISIPGDPVVSNSSSITITALGKRFVGLLRERTRVREKIVE